MATKTEYTATWNAARGVYVVAETKWCSYNGDEWRDQNDGELLDDDTFRAATIRLVGGLRDGETVA